MESSVESRMGELEEKLNEIRDSYLNADISQNCIHPLSDVIMEGALSTVMELLSQWVEDYLR